MRGSLFGTFFMAMILAVSSAQASHFRYGHITWTPTTGNEIAFTIQSAWRRTSLGGICYDASTAAPLLQTTCTGTDGSPGVGDVTANYASPITFGDGTTLSFSYALVTSIDINNDWLYLVGLDQTSLPSMDTSIEHTYPAPGDYVADFSSCCRVGYGFSGNNYHINNPDGWERVETLVNVGSGNSSPVSVIEPIKVCGIDTVCQFVIPAGDAEGDVLSFRLSTQQEAAGESIFLPGTLNPFVQPGEAGSGSLNPATVDSTTGLYSWDTNGATVVGDPESDNTLYSTQVMIEDGTSRAALDFLIRLTNVDPVPPTFPVAPDQPPICGTTQIVTVGQMLSFDVNASDPDALDIVQLNVVGLPSGATMSPSLPVSGNPISSTFSWMPTISQLGVHVISFSATSSGSGVGQTQCSATLEVTETLFIDIDFSPLSDTNPVNPSSRGLIAVVIPTSEEFDASTVDVSTVRVGVGEAVPAHPNGHLEDYDGDGDLDLVLHVPVQDTGVQCGDTSLTIKAQTLSGQSVEGTNTITTVGCSG